MISKSWIIIFIIMAGFSLKGFPGSDGIELPLPQKRGRVSLEEALDKRQSVRKYAPGSLSLEEVSQLLWACYGRNKWSKLTAPSAGALYPLAVYLAAGEVEGVAAGLYRYDSRKHFLTLVSAQDKRSLLSEAALGQSCVKDAPALIIIAADYKVTASRYGERSRRYVDIEVGHAGENVYLQAVSLGIGTVAVGAFSDEQVKEVLGIDEDPVYIMPLGRMETFKEGK